MAAADDHPGHAGPPAASLPVGAVLVGLSTGPGVGVGPVRRQFPAGAAGAGRPPADGVVVAGEL
ncbi:MAG: hypothetical protein ACLGIO_14435, partial [Acidimicrobiia bacterium]